MLKHAFIFAGLLTATAFGGPFTNGSFELPGGSPIRQALGNNDIFVTGWTNNNAFQIYESSGQDGISAGAGTYYVSWGHNGTTGGTLAQTFDTVVNQSYSVSFLLTTQQGDPTNSPQALKAEALNGVNVLGSFQTLSLTNANGVWTTSSFGFTATGTSTTLRFTDLTTAANSGGLNWGLDNVGVVAGTTPPSTTPEPSTWLASASGLALLAGFLRRRSIR